MLKPLQANHKAVIITGGFQGSGAGVTKATLILRELVTTL